ncbi:MAG: TlpA family protein disulfide reductase [Gammaproteobacteria bacterium]|nr:TlpA family protein disulfide reductase [Gammaproteobacteria bacterium]
MTKYIPAKLIAAFLLCIVISASQAVGFGDEAPGWMGINLVDGRLVEFPEVLNDKPAVLVFWATWCPYCQAFMPYVKQIQADYADHGIQIISFNALERGVGNPKAYVDALNFPQVAIARADRIAQEYDVQFIPGLMIVDANGTVVYRRKSTNLPAGRTVSEQWAGEVRQVLDILIENNYLGTE